MTFWRLILFRSNSLLVYNHLHKNCFGFTALLRQAGFHLKQDRSNKCSFSERNLTDVLCSSFMLLETDSYILESLDPSDYKCYADHIRDLLDPMPMDNIINRLKKSNTIKQVLDIVSEYNGELDVPHICQSILMLYQIHLFPSISSSDINLNLSDLKSLTTNKSFQILLKSLDTYCSSMTLTELTHCLLYLNRLGVLFTHDLLIKLVTVCELKVREMPLEEIPLNAILKLCSALRSYHTLWSLYTLKDILSLVTDRLRICNTYHEFYFITMCLHKMALLVNEGLIDIYVEKCNCVFQNSEDDESLQACKINAIDKAILFLDHNVFCEKNHNFVKKLLCSLQGNVKLLSVHDLYRLHKKLHALQEPVLLLKEINEVCADQLSLKKNDKPTFKDLLLGIMTTNKYFPRDQNDIDDCIKKYLDQASFYQSTTSFTLINSLLQSNISVKKELIILFWNKVVELMNLYPGNQLYDSLIGICIRYLSFKTILGTFSNRQFEKMAKVYLLNNVWNENVYPRVYIFTKIMALLMIFNNDNELTLLLSKETVNKMERDILRLNIHDNMTVSFLISTGLGFKQINKRPKSVFLQNYVKIVTALHENTKKYLVSESDRIGINNLNELLCGYLYRKGSVNSDVFQNIVRGYETVTVNELNSKLIRKALSTFNDFKYIVPEFVDTCVLYCIQNKDLIFVNVVGIVLNYAFSFGYWPNRLEEILNIIVNLLERDKDCVDDFAMLKCCLCLAYFNHLPYSLAKKIFNLDYIRNMEKKFLYQNGGKVSVGTIKTVLMELNRSVCIDYPEYNIPWFHEDHHPINTNYLPDASSSRFDVFYREVFNVLVKIITEENLIAINHYSPYNHRIDFFIRLKKDGTLVNPLICSDDVNTKKIAILLNSNPLEPYYYQKGKSELRRRHLEILNYKVVEIKKKYWNSMFMSEPMAKFTYIKDQIYSD